MIRNLLYNCFAPNWSTEWKSNIERLCKYADVFNGRKIVLIKTGPESVEPREIEATFKPLGNDVEFVHVSNDPKLGEVTGFINSLKLLESTDPNEITFYAHTKGTKYKGIEERFMIPIREWRNCMYDECLSDVARVEEVLKNHSCAGCYIRKGRHAHTVKSDWHFAGTFWWFNHSKVFSLANWQDITQTFYGVEGYLGKHLDFESAYCFYGKGMDHNLYATSGMFECTNCGHKAKQKMKMSQNPVKVCPKCHKRKAVYVDES